MLTESQDEGFREYQILVSMVIRWNEKQKGLELSAQANAAGKDIANTQLRSGLG